jgi:hypothetical protein
MKITFLSTQPVIERKLVETTNTSYDIGVLVGSYLPFVVLVILAYLLYFRSKKKSFKD